METEELENSSSWMGGTQMNLHSKSVASLHYLRKLEGDDKSVYVMNYTVGLVLKYSRTNSYIIIGTFDDNMDTRTEEQTFGMSVDINLMNCYCIWPIIYRFIYTVM